MKNFLKKVKNRLKFNYNCYELKKYIKNRKYRTSISDDNIYPALCQAASENPILFSKFRRNSIYNKILEHVTKEQGQEYLTVILQNRESEFSEAEWKDFKKNDLYGGPQLFVYEMGGGVS